ncbi:MAG: ATP-binding protein [Aureliella sp.]
MIPSYEKLGSFYLGKKYDLANRRLLDELVCYDAKDLTTHAMCVGMTGSGKTGLCLTLLEEAAIDGIPAIAIDPKGDLGNLLLTFPELAPSDFRPWLDEAEAQRQGISLDALAEKTATKWREGLAQWDQQPERIARLRQAVDMTIYTPGSNAGVPMTVLRSFGAPPQEVVQDADLFRERVAGAASGLLTLLGIEADPLTSREHILLSTIFSDAWSKGRDLDLPLLIRLIQNPPLDKIGVFELDSFLPAAERMKLAMSLNNLLASPAFAGWLEGQPLDIQRLLYTPEGKPRLSIISIAHLSDAERMFFVTVFLDELLAWVRTQPGTSSLRALFYMDEIYGYFPPTAKPPSKPPMMLLLKQARAYGLGIVLATQNPVDLDYKGLANIGTWFLGRLQTERDKARVLEGLEGAAVQLGSQFDRNAMEQVLAALGNRVFLMNNVHEDAPTVFQSRWAMSFLRGPLSRTDIQRLLDPVRSKQVPVSEPGASGPSTGVPGAVAASSAPAAQTPAPATKASTLSATPALSVRPHLAAEIPERFCRATLEVPAGARLAYRPALLGAVACHFVRASAALDQWTDGSWLALPGELSGELAGGEEPWDENPWGEALRLTDSELELASEPEPSFQFAPLPDPLSVAKNYTRWQKQLKDHVYRHERMRLFVCPELKAVSQPGQDELAARLALEQKLREARDAQKEKLQAKYADKVQALEGKIALAQQRVDREGAQFYKSALDIGQTVLGMLIGNKRSRASSTVRGLGRAAVQRSQSQSAQELLQSLQQERTELIHQAEADIEAIGNRFDIHAITLEPLDISCRKADLRIDLLAVAWIPWAIDEASGRDIPLIDLLAAPRSPRPPR